MDTDTGMGGSAKRSEGLLEAHVEPGGQARKRLARKRRAEANATTEQAEEEAKGYCPC